MLGGVEGKTTSQPSTLGRERKEGNGRKGRNGRGLDLLTCILISL